MGTITLFLPVSGAVITAGLHATNYSALQTLLNGNIDDANVKASAGIVRSKLDFGAGLVNADISASAAIAKSKLASLAIVDADVSAISASKITGGVGMQLIASQTLTAGQNFDFQSIPSTYSSLKVVWQGSDNSAGSQAVSVRFNNDSAANYSYSLNESISGTRNDAGVSGASAVVLGVNGSTGGIGTGEMGIPGYTTGFFKRAWGVWGTHGSSLRSGTSGGSWASGSVINRIQLISPNGWIAGSSAQLYGLS